MSKSLVAIVGRPNVGKSTLFNRLAGRWRAIVEDGPGSTRDRLIAEGDLLGHAITFMDTGGLNLAPATRIERKVSRQAERGLAEADVVVFVMDGREGMTEPDRDWVDKLRRLDKPVVFAVNKLDEPALDGRLNEFMELGVSPLLPLSAENHRHFAALTGAILKALGVDDVRTNGTSSPFGGRTAEGRERGEGISDEGCDGAAPFRLALIGRPNVGKSTLLNAVLGDERSIVDEEPGTTRDPVDTLIMRDGENYLIVDTAGIRRRAKTPGRLDKFSIMSSLKTIDKSHAVVLLVDGAEGPTDQDAHVAGYAFERHRGIVVAVNKWDVGAKKFTRERFKELLELRMNYLAYCPLVFISALTGKNVSRVFEAVAGLKSQLDRRVKTSDINRVFEGLVANHPLPTHNGRDIKMFYATQTGVRPPGFVVFCTDPAHVHFSYRRYLVNGIREAFDLSEAPIRLAFRKR